MTSKTRTLTDDNGDRLILDHNADGIAVTVILDNEGLTVGHFTPADLIAAIREVTDAEDGPEFMTKVQTLRATIAQLYSEIVKRDRQIERLEAAKPEPAPSTPPTAEDFARARFAEVDGKSVVRIDGAWAARDRGGWWWVSDLDMATLARGGRARIIREAPTDPAALLDLAWEAAHVVPEEVEWIPKGAATVLRDDDGTVTYLPDGHSVDVLARGTNWERRTLTPLPTPRPEGAERIEAIIADQSLGFNADDIAALADRIAREVQG